MGIEPQPASASLLEVRSLSVSYDDRGRTVEALRDVDLSIARGESVGVLGESGSGKSTLALALLGLAAPRARFDSGSVTFEGIDLLGATERTLDRLRGDRISIVFQEPGLALNPVLRVGRQVDDVLRAHRSLSRSAARQETLRLFERVHLDQPDSVYRAYTHQLSGGQRQRIVIAQALVCRPELLIADEPTAALDRTTQSHLIELLAELRADLGMAMVIVSHDPQFVARLSDRLVVMYAGRLVETGTSEALLGDPRHPYLRDLLRCRPHGERGVPLPTIEGAPPRLDPAPRGCAFHERCSDRVDRCDRERPALFALGGRRAACWLADPAAELGE